MFVANNNAITSTPFTTAGLFHMSVGGWMGPRGNVNITEGRQSIAYSDYLWDVDF